MRISDWSSDVCSSDLSCLPGPTQQTRHWRCRHRPQPMLQPMLRRPAIHAFSYPCVLSSRKDSVCRIVGIHSGKWPPALQVGRSEEHTSELQSLMRLSYDVFCLKNTKEEDIYLIYNLRVS